MVRTTPAAGKWGLSEERAHRFVEMDAAHRPGEQGRRGEDLDLLQSQLRRDGDAVGERELADVGALQSAGGGAGQPGVRGADVRLRAGASLQDRVEGAGDRPPGGND